MKSESGSASIYVMAAAALLIVIALPVVVVALGLVAQRHAVRAADFAVLGGAQQSLSDTSVACATAAEVARVNNAELRRCSMASGVLTIEVVVGTSLPFLSQVSATSRAGRG
ncbi:MAG: Rv3654c family TadE-like protein [Actinomycetes bacterium]